MAQQTAVQWLVQWSKENPLAYQSDYHAAIKKAMKIEEEQIIDAWNDGICIQDTNDICGEYYYKQKYKNENNS